MRKILSIFTAMLCAIAVSADPVVLPLMRVGGETTIRIPALTAWNCGWLML